VVDGMVKDPDCERELDGEGKVGIPSGDGKLTEAPTRA
jgi:hypothetical protein